MSGPSTEEMRELWEHIAADVGPGAAGDAVARLQRFAAMPGPGGEVAKAILHELELEGAAAVLERELVPVGPDPYERHMATGDLLDVFPEREAELFPDQTMHAHAPGEPCDC